MVPPIIIRRRKTMVAYFDKLIADLGDFSEGKDVAGRPFSVRHGIVHIQLRYGRNVFALPDGRSVIFGSMEEVIDELDQLRILALLGGLDSSFEKL